MIKTPTQQENTVILNLYALSNRAQKYVKHKLIEAHNYRDFNIPFSISTFLSTQSTELDKKPATPSTNWI